MSMTVLAIKQHDRQLCNNKDTTITSFEILELLQIKMGPPKGHLLATVEARIFIFCGTTNTSKYYDNNNYNIII